MNESKIRLPVAIVFIFLLTAVLIDVPLLGAGRPAEPRRYLQRRWTIDQGLPHNTVTALAQDGQGFLWVGTENGLARFDGVAFRVFHQRNTKVLENDFITSLYTDKNGVLWIGTNGGGIIRHGNRGFRRLNCSPGLDSPFIHSIGAGSGGGGTVTVELMDGDRVKLKPMRLYYELTRLSKSRPRFAIPTPSGVKDRFGVHWMGLTDGLYYKTKREGARRRKFPLLRGDIPITAMMNDDSGRIWVGTGGGGLYCLRPPRFPFYSAADGIQDSYVNCIYQDEEGRIYVGTNKGLDRFVPGTGRFQKVLSGWINTVCRDSGGAFWAGGAYVLRRIAQDGNVRYFKGIEDPKFRGIRIIKNDSAGNLWLGTDQGGLYVWRRGGFVKAGIGSHYPGPPNTPVLALADDSRGNLWIGTGQGLYKLDIKNNRYLRFTNKPMLFKYVIRALTPGSEGSLWLATANHGPICYFNGAVIPYPVDTDLAHSGIYNILEDDQGLLWLTTGNGLFVFKVHSLDYFRYNYQGRYRRPKITALRLSRGFGLRNPGFTGSGQPAGFKAQDGKFWLPTGTGITVLNPYRNILETKPRAVRIEKIRIGEKQFKPFHSPVLSMNNADLTVSFEVLNFDGAEELQFRCTLADTVSERLVREKILDYKTHQVSFGAISPGRYRFRVTAGNGLGGWNTEGADFIFRITYRIPGSEGWLLLIIGISAILLVVAVRIWDRRAREKEMFRIFKEDERYKTSGMKGRSVRKYTVELLTLMEEEKPYLDPNMSVAKLAQRLGLSKEHISQIVNQQFYMNFNQFLNKYRIEEAKKKLRDPGERDFVVLKIAHDVGFNSKSTFNTAFKKFTGISPSQYREEFLQETGPKS